MQVTSVYIINPSLKPNKPHPIEEDYQDAKLLFYYPESILLNDKRSHVGISEGVVQFFSLFAETKGYMVINSQNYTHALKEVEPNYWLNMIFFHKELFDPAEEDLEAKSKTKFAHIDDTIYENIITHCYNLFSFFHGSLDKLFTELTKENAHVLLKDYFLRYAKENINGPHIDYFPWNFNGFCYCPIEKKAFLKTQLYVNRIKEKFPFVKHSMLLFSSYMISHDLPVQYAKLLYSYITGVTEKRAKTKPRILGYEYSAINESRQANENSKALKSTSALTGAVAAIPEEKKEAHSLVAEPYSAAFKTWAIEGADKNGFLLGPLFGTPKQEIYTFMPKVYMGGLPYRLIIFNMVRLLTILVVEDKEEVCMNSKVLMKLSTHINKKARDICELLLPVVKITEEAPDTHPYYYCNYVNNAIKISSVLTNDWLRKYEVGIILNNLHHTLNARTKGISKEEGTMCAYKTSSHWIVTFKILEREICLFLSGAISMERLEEEKSKFRQTYFSGIFVL